jgi:hypothetical protein
MDEFSAEALDRLRLKQARIIRLPDIEDEALRAARANRSFGEYCWTCTAPLLLHVLEQQRPGTVVTYVDADVRFFSSPKAIIDELGDKSIFIHDHDFAPEHAHFGLKSGRFNVGVVAIRNDSEGLGCLERWRSQCLAECTLDAETGKCGDQHYLDEWPDRYNRLVISANPGVGLGPWNISKHRLSAQGDVLLVDGRPVVFYHYHALRIWRPWFGLKPVLMARGTYVFAADVVSAIYRPYARELWQTVSALEADGMSVLADLEPITLTAVYAHHIQRRQLNWSVGKNAATPIL